MKSEDFAEKVQKLYDALPQDRRRQKTGANAAFKVPNGPPPETPEQVATVRSALTTLSISWWDDRDNWLRAGAALHWTQWDCGFDLWTEFSKRSDKYDGADQERTWQSFTHERNGAMVTLGTLFHEANKEQGWIDPRNSTDSQPVAVEPSSSPQDKELIAELAALPALDYERRRAAVAEKLGVRVAALDRSVDEYRQRDDVQGAGSSVRFDDPEPCSESVSGVELLNELSTTFQRFAVMPEHGADALALWVVFTYLTDVLHVAPILALQSPEPRCGKTTVLSLVARLAKRVLPASNISTAALFRSVEKWRPTLLIDEADSFLRDNDELRGVLNSGHTRDTAYVVRVVGDDLEPRRFSTWGAKAIALIGKLPETLRDRSIGLELRRKLQSEHVESLRHTEDEPFDRLRSRIARFVADNREAVRTCRPRLPDSLNDRAADNWEPLLAIATVVGGDWTERARQAATELSREGTETRGTNVELLGDIRQIFEAKGIERIATTELIQDLCMDDERPWSTYNRGKWITAWQLGKRLRGFGVVPQTVRSGPAVFKGYRLADFADAFGRYLPNSIDPPSDSVTRLQPNARANLRGFDLGNISVTKNNSVTRKPAASKACNRVTEFSPSDRRTEDIRVDPVKVAEEAQEILAGTRRGSAEQFGLPPIPPYFFKHFGLN